MNLFGCQVDIFMFCFLPLSLSCHNLGFFVLPCKADDVHKAKYNGILSSLWTVQLFNWCSWDCVAL